PFLHGFGKLPRDHFLDGLGLCFFQNALIFQEFIDTGTQVLITHRSNSFLRLRANSRSSFGVVRVFLIKPCSATSRSRYRQIKTRAVRLVADPSGFPTARCPSLGIRACPRAIATVRATNLCRSRGAPPPEAPAATPAPVHSRRRCGKRPAESSSVACRL